MSGLKKRKKIGCCMKTYLDRSKMRGKEGLVFLIMALLSFSIHPSASPHLVYSQENASAAAAAENLINGKRDQGSGTAIAHQSKFGRGAAVAGGGNGGQAAISGGNGQAAASGGNGDGSHSPYAQGGGSATPVYAAGAGNNHHNHRGGGNRNKSRAGLATFAITAFACFLLGTGKDL